LEVCVWRKYKDWCATPGVHRAGGQSKKEIRGEPQRKRHRGL